MRSCIYNGFVEHLRIEPVRHRLRYPLYVYCLDLDEDAALPGNLSIGQKSYKDFKDIY